MKLGEALWSILIIMSSMVCMLLWVIVIDTYFSL